MDIPLSRPAHPAIAASRPALARCGLALAIAALVLLAYRGIELNGFHFDDWPNILYRSSLQMDQFSFAALADAGRDAFLARRPVASVSFALDWWRGGGAPGPFLVTNLILHVLAAWAGFALLAATLPERAARAPLAAVVAAAAGAAWWALQPIQVQAVSYVVQRMTGLAALFSVLTVWAYLRGRRSPARAPAWWALALGAFALGALSKENAWITPALVLMAEYLVVRADAPLVRRPLDRALLALPLVALAAVLVDVAADGPLSRWALYGYAQRDFTLAERLLTQPKVVLFHVSQLLWPLPARFGIEHDLAIVRSAASWQFWLPMAVITAWCAAGLAFAARRGRRVIGFFMLWVPVTLLIESSAVPLEMVFEHRMYLPSLGFAGLLAIALGRAFDAPRARRPAAALAAAAIAFALWATAERIPQWRTEATLYEQAVALAPNSVRAWNQLGVEYLAEGRVELARQAIERANAIEPRWGDGYPFLNWGVVLEALGQRERARAIYDETIRLFPNQVLGYNNRGLLHLRDGQLDSAVRDFDVALALDPEYPQVWTNRGTARFLQGELSLALADLERAVSLSPRESVAFHYLARIYARLGKPVEADRARARACRLGVAADCG